MRPAVPVDGPLLRELSIPVPASDEGVNLEQFLRSRGCSHHVLLHLKHTPDGILLNGKPVYSSQLLKKGDLVTVRVRESFSSPERSFPNDSSLNRPSLNRPSPERSCPDLRLAILYEDKDLLVINKPAGLPVYRSRNEEEMTLADAARAFFAARNLPFTFHCINRLDRDTSGALILAKHVYSAALLGAAAQQHRITREYVAVVEGILPPHGTICAPIARKPGSPLMREVNETEGEEAVTHYRRIALYGNSQNPGLHIASYGDCKDPGNCFSVARIHLETGRTHQIRVHMKHIGHPLLGDFLYNPGHTEIPGTGISITRQALHARKISFVQPFTGYPVQVTAPWPEDFSPFICDTARPE